MKYFLGDHCYFLAIVVTRDIHETETFILHYNQEAILTLHFNNVNHLTAASGRKVGPRLSERKAGIAA